MKKEKLLFLFASLCFTSCGSTFWEGVGETVVGGMYNTVYSSGTNLYGSSNTAFSNMWNNAVSVPSSLDPNTAADAAAKQAMSNIATGFWDDVNAGQQYIENQTKDFWKNVDPATLEQTLPVQGGGAVGGSTVGGSVSSSSRSSGSRSSTSSSRQHDLCNGTGKCNSCNGTGSIWKGYGMSGKTKCPNCHGSGRCSGCNGTGRR